MFTGIIQDIGTVTSASESHGNLLLEVEGRLVAGKLKIGDSISVNGACQTVVSCHRERFRVEAIAETISRSNLGDLRNGSQVNLELPLSSESLLHGHLVQGHIDCTGRIVENRPVTGSTVFRVEYPDQYGRYLIEKGSVAIDGVSLTVIEVRPGSFKVSIIPHTIKNTIFHYRKVGDNVNLEFDLIAKYIEKMLFPEQGKLTNEFLKEHGF